MTARASDPLPLRPQISESWQRSVARGISAHLPASPSVLTDADLQRRRSGHPLDRVRPLLEDVLGEAVRDCEAVLALGDAEGHLLWITGPRTALRRAERIGFVPGSNWDERALGTNAPGTALRLDTALAVRGAEHYLDAIRSWSCAATPIHHPTTGAVLGVLDVTGGRQVALPQTLAMVRAAARMAEAELARTLATLPSRPPTGEPADFTLDVLGRAEALLRSGADRTQPIRLGQRHAEMLVLLGTHPAGLTGDELAELVYPHPVSQPDDHPRRGEPAAHPPGAGGAGIAALPAARHDPRRLVHRGRPARGWRCGSRGARLPRPAASSFLLAGDRGTRRGAGGLASGRRAGQWAPGPDGRLDPHRGRRR